MFAVESPTAARVELASLMRVYNLRLPFRISMTARRGRHRVSGERRRGVLCEGESVTVERYRTLNYEGATEIDPRVGYELHLMLHDDAPCAASFAARIAHAVFRDPACDWSIALAAQRMETSARHVTAQLFRENSAFMTIVREQRLMRALLTLLAQPHARSDLADLASQCGFASAARLDDAFDAHFGSPASRIARQAWYPALTWSFSRAGERKDRSKERNT
jgi:AraC-like DNA-binding protein